MRYTIGPYLRCRMMGYPREYDATTMAQQKKRKNPHGKTMDYYRKNPKAYAKKKKYELKRAKTEKAKKNFNERRRFKRKHGLVGKMGNRDVSHTKSGKLVLEKRSANRRRNGENGKSRKK